MPEITLRESAVNTVQVLVDGVVKYSHREYRGAVQWVEGNYPPLSPAEWRSIYNDYREDYDSRG